MPPSRSVARRPVKALGSLQLVTHANNPTKVITELAYITDERLNSSGESSQAQSSINAESDAPLDVSFDEFINGVNSRGRGTGVRHRRMTVEQADAILLVMVQKGHVDLIASQDDPSAIETIRILPEAKRTLAAFLPKLRGYGDVPYDQEYRGAIALAKRHFFPNGRAPTKKELMALLLQSYQERRELKSRLKAPIQRPATRTLSIQTSLASIEADASLDIGAANEMEEEQPVLAGIPDTIDQPSSRGSGEPRNNDNGVDMVPDKPNLAAPPANQRPNIDHNYQMPPEPEREPAVSLAPPCTPAPTRFVNPYMTPVSNPRRGDHTMTVLPDSPPSPTPSIRASPSLAPDVETDSTVSGQPPLVGKIEEMLQASATSQGMLICIWERFVAMESNMVAMLQRERDWFKKEYEHTKKMLDESERKLRESNHQKWKLACWVQSLFAGERNWFQEQIAMFNGMMASWQDLQEPATGGTGNTDEWIVHDAGMQNVDSVQNTAYYM